MTPRKGELFASIDIDRAQCPMFVVSSAGRILRTNRRAAERLGRRKSDLRGRLLSEVLRLPDDPLLWFRPEKPAGAVGVVGRKGELLPTVGEPLRVEAGVQAVDRRGPERFLILACELDVDCGAASDVIPRLRDIAEAQERERQRIARELHDEALQGLLVAGMEVERLMQSAKSGTGLLAESLVSLRSLLRQVETDVRHISGRMRPDTVPQCGLLDAVGNEVQTLQARGLDAELRFRGTPVPVDPNVQILAYRIVQEALHNVCRHSGASRVRTTVTCRGGRLVIRVTDNGRGFVLPSGFAQRGATEFLGIKGMYERASLMNAVLDIRSHPGVGTAVSLRIPIVSPS